MKSKFYLLSIIYKDDIFFSLFYKGAMETDLEAFAQRNNYGEGGANIILHPSTDIIPLAQFYHDYYF